LLQSLKPTQIAWSSLFPDRFLSQGNDQDAGLFQRLWEYFLTAHVAAA
jgi:hypothetical protein